jgi:two-component system cell cycle sensor histidine kinase/response regulator CckA
MDFLFDDRKPGTPKPPPENEYPSGDETILIVEDDQIVIHPLRAVLQEVGYTVLVAENGQVGVDICEGHDGPIHLCLLDMRMPVMDGATAFPLMKEHRPDMKVIISSGYDQDESAQRLLMSGASIFLHKPVPLKRLLQEIRRVLDEK